MEQQTFTEAKVFLCWICHMSAVTYGTTGDWTASLQPLSSLRGRRIVNPSTDAETQFFFTEFLNPCLALV